MKRLKHDPRLAGTLSDPLIRSVMAADDVDPRELEAMLSEIASILDRRPAQAAPRCGCA